MLRFDPVLIFFNERYYNCTVRGWGIISLSWYIETRKGGGGERKKTKKLIKGEYSHENKLPFCVRGCSVVVMKERKEVSAGRFPRLARPLMVTSRHFHPLYLLSLLPHWCKLSEENLYVTADVDFSLKKKKKFFLDAKVSFINLQGGTYRFWGEGLCREGGVA